MKGPSRADFLVVAMARQIPDRAMVATGLLSWLPMLAVAVARATHAPQLTYLNCAGAIDPSIQPLPPSSTDVRLLKDNQYFMRLTDLWEFAARGRIDVMFFGFTQVDRHGNTNLTLLYGANGRTRKLPGVAGAFCLRQLVRNPVLFCTRHSRATFVGRVDTVTTEAPHKSAVVVTDLGVFRVTGGKLDIVSVHPRITIEDVVEKTIFTVRRPSRLRNTLEPSLEEWRALDKFDPRGIRNRSVEP